jgi:hypothetical protein
MEENIFKSEILESFLVFCSVCVPDVS